jgi:hypothetical protein
MIRRAQVNDLKVISLTMIHKLKFLRTDFSIQDRIGIRFTAISKLGEKVLCGLPRDRKTGNFGNVDTLFPDSVFICRISGRRRVSRIKREELDTSTLNRGRVPGGTMWIWRKAIAGCHVAVVTGVRIYDNANCTELLSALDLVMYWRLEKAGRQVWRAQSHTLRPRKMRP